MSNPNLQIMKNIVILGHPLIQDKLAILRNEKTGREEFRRLVEEITMFMGYEVTKDLPLVAADVITPMGKALVRIVSEKKPFIIAVWRAGDGMVPGMLKIMPTLKVGHLGIFRDEKSLQPVVYYNKLPDDCSQRDAILLDPMLATGGSASCAITLLKAKGVKNIKFMCLVASEVGISRINNDHPDVQIFCAALDEKLLENGYIFPGLGDAGDRLYGTK